MTDLAEWPLKWPRLLYSLYLISNWKTLLKNPKYFLIRVFWAIARKDLLKNGVFSQVTSKMTSDLKQPSFDLGSKNVTSDTQFIFLTRVFWDIAIENVLKNYWFSRTASNTAFKDPYLRQDISRTRQNTLLEFFLCILWGLRHLQKNFEKNQNIRMSSFLRSKTEDKKMTSKNSW